MAVAEKFYVKTSNNQYTVATTEQIDNLFKEESDRIIAGKAKRMREKLRKEVESELREELLPKLEFEATQKVAATHNQDLKDEITRLKVQICKKDILLEYNFCPEAEKLIADGTKEEMRTQAKTLKEVIDQSLNSSAK